MAPSHTDGLLVIDKPKGITSRDAVDRALRWLPRGTRLGHTGTLDPLATGVLVLCAGSATRLTEYVQRMAKTYRAGIVLGAQSDTDDADGTISPVSAAAAPAAPAAPTAQQLRAALDALTGPILQVPPAYSAAKVSGRRAYDLARRGDDVRLAARAVTVYGIDLLRYDYPLVEIEVRCGKGTYIRSLARDLGQQLGCGGYVQTLRRTRVGCFDVTAAIPLDADAATARRALLPVAQAVCELPRRVLSAIEAARVRQGQPLPLARSDPAEGEVALFDEGNTLVAVAAVDAANQALRPGKVFPV